MYATSSADSVTTMTSPATIGGESTVSAAIEQPVTTSETGNADTWILSCIQKFDEETNST